MLQAAITLACLLGLSVPPAARAQTASLPGSADGHLVRNEEGFSLDLFGGFELGKYRDGYYLLGSRTIPGLILLKSLPGLTAAQLDRNLQSGYSDRTVQLTPESGASELNTSGGEGKLVDVSGSLYKDEVRGLLAGYLRPDGGGLLLFAVTSPKQWPELSQVAAQIARSVSLFHPDPQELIETWKERLSGFQLVHAPAEGQNRGAGADTSTRAYALCGDGSFVYDPNTQPVSERPAKGAANPSGTWNIVPRKTWAELSLKFRDGRSQSYRLTRSDHETYLDDQRYFVLSYEGCR